MNHFSDHEFYCCEACRNGIKDMNQDFLFKLDIAREYSGVPFILDSSIRCEEHNAKVGGKENSAHLSGLAVDIFCDSDSKRYLILEACKLAGITRFGVAKNYVHVDVDLTKNRKRFWVY